MRSALAVLLVVVPVAASAQRRPAGVEASVGAVGAFARLAFVGGAVGLAWRGGQGRAAATVAGGALGAYPAARVEVSAQFVINPSARSRAALYGGLGVAYVAARDAGGAGYVLLLVGAERAAGRAVGWFVEGGLGGGTRLAAGVRARRAARPPR